MAKVYTTSTASYKIPVILSFTCPKCGRRATVNRTGVLSAQATVRGYNNAGAGQAARRNLAASADSQVDFLVERLEKGQLNALLDESGRNGGGNVLCPNCGIRQIVQAGGKRNALYPKWFAGKLAGVFFGASLVVGVIMGMMRRRGPISSNIVSLLMMLCVAAVVGAVIYNAEQSKKAYADPALMEKRYNSVLNPRMSAVLILGVGSTRSVDIPKRG